MRRLAAIAFVGALAAAAPAVAVADEIDDCVRGSDPELQRSACTAVIAAGLDSGDDLSWAYYNRAYANYNLEAFEAAVRDLDEAIGIDPEYGKAHGLRCSAHIKLEDLDAALTDCSRDIELRPDNPTSYYNRALAHCRMGDVEAAIADIQSEWTVAPSEVETDQRMLEERGFYDGPINGGADEPTLEALRAWAEAGC